MERIQEALARTNGTTKGRVLMERIPEALVLTRFTVTLESTAFTRMRMKNIPTPLVLNRELRGYYVPPHLAEPFLKASTIDQQADNVRQCGSLTDIADALSL